MDTASSGGDGTTQATSGAHAAFATIATVNGYTYTGDDQILFKRGDTWREQLTVPSSGTNGHPITFGAYPNNSDPKPIISGADVLTGWVDNSIPLGGPSGTKDIDDNFNDNDISDWTNKDAAVTAGSGVMTVTVTNGVQQKAVKQATSRNELWGSFDFSYASAGLTFAASKYMEGGGLSSGIAVRAEVGLINDVGGNTYFRVGYGTDSGTTAVTTATRAYPDTAYHIVERYKKATSAGANDGIVQVWVNGTSILNLTTVDNDTINSNGFKMGNNYGPSGVNMVLTIDNALTAATGSAPLAGPANTWKADLAAEPTYVIIGGTLGTKRASQAACVSSGDYFWSAGSLYIYSTTNPNSTPVVEAPVRSYAVELQQSYVTIDGFNLKLPTNSAMHIGESAVSSDYNTIQNCTIQYVPGFGWKSGIILNHGTHNTITGNTITDSYVGINLSSYHASATDRDTDNNTVSHNIILRIDSTGISIAAGSSSSYQPANNIVEYNDVSLCSQTFDDTGGIVTSRAGTGNIIRYNKSYNNGLDPTTMRGTGIMIDENSNGEQVYYNIVYGNTSSGIGTSGDSTLIYNNTLYNNPQGVYLFYSGITHDSSANSLIKNNIILANGNQSYVKVRSEAVASGGNVFDYNDYYGSSKLKPFSWDSGGPPADDHNWTEWQVHNPEANSKVLDPLFTSTSDFHLQSTSPAINAGTDVGLTSDYASNPIWGAPDIGAYESQPPYTFASNNIPTTGTVRLYSNGQYQMTIATSSSATVNFSVQPVGGWYTASTSEYMNISLNTWTSSDKNWTASSSPGGIGYTHATSTVYTLTGLTPNTSYTFRLDSAPSTALTSSQCSGFLCTADGSGNLAFTYTGGYSSHTFDLQATPTITSVVSPTTPSAVKTPSFSFSSTENGTLLSAGSCTPSSTSVSSGANSFTFTTLADGTYANCAFSVIDSSGNDSATTTLASFLIDTTGPTGSIANASGSPTNSVTPTFNLTIADAGVGIASAQMRFSCDNVSYSTWESFASTKTNFNIDTGAGCTNADGSKTIYAQFRDALSNPSISYHTDSFTLDTVAKNAALSNTPATYGIYTAATTASINVAGTGVIAYKYKLDSGTYGSETLIASPITLSSLSEGSHTLSIIGKDSAGNWQDTGSPTTYAWTVDLTGPIFSSFTPADSGTMASTDPFSWSATDAASGVGTYNFYLDGSLATSGLTGASYTPSTALVCGSHTWYVRAIDNVNNYTDSNTLTATVSCPSTTTVVVNGSISPIYFPPTTSAPVSIVSPKDIQNTVPQTTSTYHFTRNLSLHQTGTDVQHLQQFLNTHGFTVSITGPGSKGNETTLFGLKTYQALMKYQKSQGLPATGWFGPMTRGKISTL